MKPWVLTPQSYCTFIVNKNVAFLKLEGGVTHESREGKRESDHDFGDADR